MPQQRVHNEWFMSSSYPRCECGSNKQSLAKAGQDTTICIWGEYHNGKWRRIMTMCEACFQSKVIPLLRAHATPCGCTFVLNPRSGHSIPPWVKLPDDFKTCAVKAA